MPATAPPPRGDDAQSPALFTPRQVTVILIGLLTGMFLAALDQTVIATSIRTIADDLDGLSLQAWVTTAYLITSTVVSPLYGKLSDIYGRRPFFLISIITFILGSVLCGLATSMYELAAFRAVQGVGGGGLFSIALAIIGDIVPPRERARYQGYFIAVFGTSSVLGPLIGGFFAARTTILGITGWRWVFLVNVPIGLVSLLIVTRTLHLPHHRRDHRIDYPGAAALVVGLVPLLLVAEQGRGWGWTSGRSLACYVTGAVGTVAFLLAERAYGNEALLPLRLFRQRTFSVCSTLNAVLGIGMFGAMALLPLFLQIVKGVSPTQAGLLLVPMTIGHMTGSILSGQIIARTGRYRFLPITGLTLLVIGSALLTTIEVDLSVTRLGSYTVLIGLGLGLCMQTLVLAVQNAVPPGDMGVATASATFFRQLGGTLGTAVFISVLFNGLTDRISEAFRAAASTPAFRSALTDPEVLTSPADRPVLDMLARGVASPTAGANPLEDSSFINQLDPRLARPFLIGFSEQMGLVFVLVTAILAVAWVIVWFLPEEPLRTVSGIQARQEEVLARQGATDGSPEGGGREDPAS
jgi:EmrB/QacA subfamily drug resistance transporter